MNHRIYALTLAAAAISLGACADDSVTTGPSTAALGLRLSNAVGGSSYVLMTSGGRFADDIGAQIAAAGGQLQSNMPAIGVATAVSDDPNFAARARKISGVSSVDADQVVQWVKPERVSEEVNVEAVAAQPSEAVAHVFGGDETFWNFQWNARAINAPDAWAAGQIGTGARVAVIDGGMSKNHIDLVGRIDETHSASFVAGFTWDQDAGTANTFRHATHVAGIIAANDNGIGTIGIAPGATIISVKALQNGSGSFGAIINAIEYASAPISEGGAGANIINMSLGATFALEPLDGRTHLLAALSRATSHARQRGVLVIAATGNNGLDLDHAQHVVSIPAQSVGVLAIAATGPNGFALGSTDFARPAAYSNIGQSLVSFAAPGGADDLPGNAICSIPRIPSGAIVNFCWVFDLVLSPGSGTTGYNFADGTSMAAPAAAGVAALIWGKYGPMSPAALEARLRSSSTDLGKPGNDDFYGAGFVNAGAAVR
jgi:lantibiotic leader peptide-processing serine protease